MPDQSCPLCGGPAAFSGHDYGRRKGFSCQNCTEFIITVSAEERLKESPQTWRNQLIEEAKATPEGKILVITIPNRHQPDAQNVAVLSREYQTREN